jgi:ADP-dependent NAD(P)H-hydrate dehydratase
MRSQGDLLTPHLLRAWPLPAIQGSKYERGQILVIGGARPTPGAAMLSATAAMRVGGGHLTLGVAESVAVAVAVALPESGVIGLPENDAGAVCGLDAVAERIEAADVVLLGPGLNEPSETAQLLVDAVGSLGEDTRMVLDADALIALAALDDPPELEGRLVLTPNIREASALLERSLDDIEERGAEKCAVEVARRHQAVTCLQGVVARPDGAKWLLSTGSPGLAMSGSGDVLAGVIAGLLARGADLDQAAAWGTYLHAAAGDRLTARVGATGFLARELLDQLPGILVELLAPTAG